MLQEAATVVLIFRHIQCLHLINSEVAWVLVSSRTQVQSQIILDPDYTIFPFLMTTNKANTYHHLPAMVDVIPDFGRSDNMRMLLYCFADITLNLQEGF